jgi:hypothetical protein
MATSSMVPYSNPAGNNQTTPTSGGTKSTLAPAQVLPGVSNPVSGTAATTNPLIPATATPGMSTVAGTAATVPAANIPNNTTSASSSEINNIFGEGVGGDINSFLGSISGTNSVVLQDYIESLQPQMAKAQAQTNAALGAGGVSADSSVAAIADASLQAQETASIAGESANLTEAGLQMQESMIQGMEAPAENYTNNQAMMPWEIAGGAIGAAGSIAAAVI